MSTDFITELFCHPADATRNDKKPPLRRADGSRPENMQEPSYFAKALACCENG